MIIYKLILKLHTSYYTFFEITKASKKPKLEPKPSQICESQVYDDLQRKEIEYHKIPPTAAEQEFYERMLGGTNFEIKSKRSIL